MPGSLVRLLLEKIWVIGQRFRAPFNLNQIVIQDEALYRLSRHVAVKHFVGRPLSAPKYLAMSDASNSGRYIFDNCGKRLVVFSRRLRDL